MADGFDYSKEYEEIVRVYSSTGANLLDLLQKTTASAVVNGNKVLGKTEVEGIKINLESFEEGVKVKVIVEDNVVIENPVHLCFGMTPEKGRQVIKSSFVIGKNSKVSFLSHCMFPNAKDIEHVMEFDMKVKKNAKVEYFEEHFHPEEGHVIVKPKLRAVLEEKAVLEDEFKIVKGKVGFLDLDYEVKQEKSSTCNLITKAYGKKDDKIIIKESLYLDGENASGTAKSRIVLTENSSAKVLGEIIGNAANTRGHVDCHEIVQGDKAKAEAVPKIAVNHPLARITHEASIGRINKKEIETLMSRGLSEEQAIDFIVKGILK